MIIIIVISGIIKNNDIFLIKILIVIILIIVNKMSKHAATDAMLFHQGDEVSLGEKGGRTRFTLSQLGGGGVRRGWVRDGRIRWVVLR